MNEQELKQTFGASSKRNFEIIDIIGVPHPYCITSKHLQYNTSMYLGKEQIEDMEKTHGKMCGVFGCNLLYNEHKQALLVSCKADLKDKDGNINKELHKYLLKCKPLAVEHKFEGFAFLDRRSTNG